MHPIESHQISQLRSAELRRKADQQRINGTLHSSRFRVRRRTLFAMTPDERRSRQMPIARIRRVFGTRSSRIAEQ